MNPIPTEILLQNMIREFLNEAMGRGITEVTHYWLMIWVKNLFDIHIHDTLSLLIQKRPTIGYEIYSIEGDDTNRVRNLFSNLFGLHNNEISIVSLYTKDF